MTSCCVDAFTFGVAIKMAKAHWFVIFSLDNCSWCVTVGRWNLAKEISRGNIFYRNKKRQARQKKKLIFPGGHVSPTSKDQLVDVNRKWCRSCQQISGHQYVFVESFSRGILTPFRKSVSAFKSKFWPADQRPLEPNCFHVSSKAGSGVSLA